MRSSACIWGQVGTATLRVFPGWLAEVRDFRLSPLAGDDKSVVLGSHLRILVQFEGKNGRRLRVGRDRWGGASAPIQVEVPGSLEPIF